MDSPPPSRAPDHDRRQEIYSHMVPDLRYAYGLVK